MPEAASEIVPELASRLLDILARALESPGLWTVVGVAGVASLSLTYFRQMYAVREREKSRRQIADHVADGSLAPEIALALLHGEKKVRLTAEGFQTASWTLGPLGLVSLIAGLLLALIIHPAFFGIAAAGAACLTLGLSFAVIAKAKRRLEANTPSDR